MLLQIYLSILLSLPVHSFFEFEVDLEPINRTLLAPIVSCNYDEAQEFKCNTMDGIPEESHRNTRGFWHSCSVNCEFRHHKQPFIIEASRIIIEAYHHGIDTEIRVSANYDEDSSTVKFTGTNSWQKYTIDSRVFNMTRYNYIAFNLYSSPENFSVLDKIRFELVDFTTPTEPTTSTPTELTTFTPTELTTFTPTELTTFTPTEPTTSTTTEPTTSTLTEPTTSTPTEPTTSTTTEPTTSTPTEPTTTTEPTTSTTTEPTTSTTTEPTTSTTTEPTTSTPTQPTGSTQTTTTTPTEPTTTVTSTQYISTERSTRSSTRTTSSSTYATFSTVSGSTTEYSSIADSENFLSFSNVGFIVLFASIILIGIGGCIFSFYYFERRQRRKEKHLEDPLGPETPYIILPLPSSSNQMSNQSPADINNTANQLNNYGLTKRQVGGAEIYSRAQNPSSVYSYGTGDYFPRLARGGS